MHLRCALLTHNYKTRRFLLSFLCVFPNLQTFSNFSPPGFSWRFWIVLLPKLNLFQLIESNWFLTLFRKKRQKDQTIRALWNLLKCKKNTAKFVFFLSNFLSNIRILLSPASKNNWNFFLLKLFCCVINPIVCSLLFQKVHLPLIFSFIKLLFFQNASLFFLNQNLKKQLIVCWGYSDNILSAPSKCFGDVIGRVCGKLFSMLALLPSKSQPT